MTTRTFNFGTVEIDGYPHQHTVKVEITLQEKDKKPVFTASASCGNIMGGQCIDDIWEECQDQLKFKELYKEIMELWEKYHLNEMKAWCEHQNYGEDMQEEVTVYHLSGNEEYERLSKIRELPERYLEVTEEGLKNVPLALYEYSSYKLKNNTHKEIKSTGWITYDELYAPEGLIGRECPECGAKYGHGWYYMPIPENDLNRIKGLLKIKD